MFFVVSKILGFIGLPSNLMLIVGIVGALLLLFTWRKRLGQGLMVASLGALVVAGWSPLGNWLMAGLENRFPAWSGAEAPDGIVVLGGAVSPALSAGRGAVALNESAERMTAVADLARRYPKARIVFSGGSGRLMGGPAEADFVLPLFESFGIARERVILEANSRNTAENASFSRDMAQPKPGERWLLVTSAYHMPRSVGAFRREGFAVLAYPVDWRTGAGDSATPFSTLSAGLARVDAAMHEWAGLLVYWITRRSSELWPQP